MSTTAQKPGQNPHENPVVSFIIGLSIVLLASILNAAGLNLTKLDHVRTSAIPKAARKKDWMRPLWLLGMILYILSQLIGSTLALGYMRAEYVAPLGSTSLVFNFLFARFLVGTPVTNTDIYGTIVVTLGVIGIVAFGSINSGLTNEMDVVHLTYLWRRLGWLGYFFAMTAALLVLLILISRLDLILTTRGDVSAPSLAGTPSAAVTGLPEPNTSLTLGQGSKSFLNRVLYLFSFIKAVWEGMITFVTKHLEAWAAPKDDKYIAWTLGIGWACCGGGLAGGCLVFAKATVKLLSGSLSHENKGNQFGHFTPIVTIILLAITAVLQIICLNRGLKIYDSTLVVPVFYGIYTATGWLDSLIFNDEVESYKSWTLFLIFVSILVLISGVVLLTHKKPEPIKSRNAQGNRRRQKPHSAANGTLNGEGHRRRGEGLDGEEQALWALGEDSDSDDDMGEDEDVDHHQNPINHGDVLATKRTVVPRSARGREVDEHTELVESELEFADGDRDKWSGTGMNDLSRAGSSGPNFRPQR